MSKVVAFDIGIKNLAYCVLEASHTNAKTIIALENATLIEEVEPIMCSNTACKCKATVKVAEEVYCRRHCPKTHRVLPALMGKKLPVFRTLKALVAEHQLSGPTNSIDACLVALRTRFALPVRQPKTEVAARLSLQFIHDSLRAFVRDRWEYFTGCTHVLLENQPVLKNPHMKSVQVLLFATLREAYLREGQDPIFRLVHASKKTRDVITDAGDKGYAQRKQASEEAARKAFTENRIVGEEWRVRWEEAKKKSDMADAICMAMQQFDEMSTTISGTLIEDAAGL